MSDRFYSSNESICPLVAMEIHDVKTLNGTIIPETEWQNYFSLHTNGSFTMKKFDTPVDHWQIYMKANNSRIYSSVINQVDFTIRDPFTNITVTRSIVEYIKPKVRFEMTRNSSGFAEDMEFKFPIPKPNETKPIKIQDILFFDPKFMNFDFESQTIIFYQSKTPHDKKNQVLRFSLNDFQGNEKQNYEVNFDINWTIKDKFEEEDEG